MADFSPVAGVNDLLMTATVAPAGATVDGNMIGVCVDPADPTLEVPLPSGYSFVEESQFVTRLRCPTTADANDAADLIIGQKADADLAAGDPVYIKGNTFTVKTIAPGAGAVTTGAGLVPHV